MADASVPVLEFLLRADGLGEFVLWAQDVLVGDRSPVPMLDGNPGVVVARGVCRVICESS
jgi:hypothetical protein